jgi:hypothetical protein
MSFSWFMTHISYLIWVYAYSFGHFTDLKHWFIAYWTVWYEDMVSG